MSPLSPQQASRLAPARPPSQQGSPRPLADRTRQAAHSPTPVVSAPKDFSYLLRPEIYHPLTPLSIPLPFRNSVKQPQPDTSLQELLARGHYRAAAIAAVHALTGTAGATAPDPSDHARIFSLIYTRLACLTLIDSTQLAAQEVKALEDLNSAFYIDEVSGVHLVPWELRVLNVRLQAMGFGDPRRAIMSYYDLAKEARARIADATSSHDNSARELWKDRLCDLGIKVAGALVEMDDLAGAAAHLSTLKDQRQGDMAMSKALLWLHLGDVDAARQCIATGGVSEKTIAALCAMADGEYLAAIEIWKDLQENVNDEMIGVNMAVCLLYVGKLEEVNTTSF